MTAAFARTGVTCVQGAVIVNLDQLGLERIDEPFVDVETTACVTAGPS